MTELAPVINIFTKRRLDHVHPVPSPDDIDQAERNYNQRRYEYHTALAERHWRLAEPYARKLGYLAERGLTEEISKEDL